MNDARQQSLTVDAIKAMVAKARAGACLRPIRLEGTDYYIWHPALGWLDPDKVRLT